jgi:hypothetical protein
LSISLSIVSKFTLPGASLIMPSTARPPIPVDIRRVDGIVVGDGEQHRDSLSGVLGQSRRDPQRQRLLTACSADRTTRGSAIIGAQSNAHMGR